MNKRLILVLALALAMGVCFAAYAEVQNVKVSGDLTIMAVARDNLDLAKKPLNGQQDMTADVSLFDDYSRNFLSIARVRVDADLTDNVGVTIRLLNERDWNGESAVYGYNNTNIGLNSSGSSPTLGAANSSSAERQVDIDLAYVTLKEFLYSPLTLTIGRQALRFGNGWIVGDPDTNGLAYATALAEGDLSARKSFDAVRATLNYSPLTVDIIYAKISEANVNLNDDVTLSGLNATYELDKNTTIEGFYFFKSKGVDATVARLVDTNANYTAPTVSNLKDKADKVHTIGGRLVNKTVKNFTVDLQSAFQFGTYNPKFDPNAHYVNVNNKSETVPRKAWGIEVIGTYDLKDVAMLSKYSPSISALFVYLSGESRNKIGDSNYRAWDPMFEDQTVGHLVNAILGFSNCYVIGTSMQAKPIEDIGVKLDYAALWFAKKYPAVTANGTGNISILSGVSTAREFRMKDKPFIGQEVDLTLTYDYTEDVQFSLLGGLFMPGPSINDVNEANNPKNAAATEVIGSMKVTF